MDRTADLLATSPKAELHVHVEGTLEPELSFALARRNKMKLLYPDVEALRRAYAFTDLQSFLDLYYAGAGVLRTEEDFFDLAWAYFQRAARDQVVHAELFFDPQTHTDRGIGFEVFMPAFASAARRAREEFGLTSEWILCFLRDRSEDEALATLEEALAYREHFCGVGLDSAERGNPPAKFSRAFARAADLGLRRVAHAGEEGPAAYVREALDVLGAERIDHGVRAVEDAALVERLVREQVPLTVCPLSNVRLCVFDDLAQHNLPRLLRAGLKVTVNSDDPAYFGGYVSDNLVQLFAVHPELGAADAYALLRNSLEASFAPEDTKSAWIAQLDQLWQPADTLAL